MVYNLFSKLKVAYVDISSNFPKLKCIKSYLKSFMSKERLEV